MALDPYATLDDWDVYAVAPTTSGTAPAGVEPSLSASFTDAQRLRFLRMASDFANSLLSKRYTLPITGYGEDLREAICAIAYATAITVRGYNPDGPDKMIQLRADARRAWLKMISDGAANLVGAVDVTPEVEDMVGVVVTAARTGWIYAVPAPEPGYLRGGATSSTVCTGSLTAA